MASSQSRTGLADGDSKLTTAPASSSATQTVGHVRFLEWTTIASKLLELVVVVVVGGGGEGGAGRRRAADGDGDGGEWHVGGQERRVRVQGRRALGAAGTAAMRRRRGARAQGPCAPGGVQYSGDVEQGARG